MFAKPPCRQLRFVHLQAAVVILQLAVLVSIVGCGTEDPRIGKWRSEFLLTNAPGGTTSLADAKAHLAESPTVVFEGRVGPGPDNVFTSGKAAFLVTEILSDEHTHAPGHDADNCPFCKRRAAKAPLAAVRFVDGSGEVLAIDARDLFGLKTGDSVVISGKGKILDELELFEVTASGIFLKPDKL